MMGGYLSLLTLCLHGDAGLCLQRLSRANGRRTGGGEAPENCGRWESCLASQWEMEKMFLHRLKLSAK